MFNLMPDTWEPEEVETEGDEIDLAAVYADGWLVAEQGGDCEHCPHKEGTKPWSAWIEGYTDGKNDKGMLQDDGY